MPWMFRSCGSFQESNFTILRPLTSLSTLIPSGVTLAATLDLVSHDLISLHSSHLIVYSEAPNENIVENHLNIALVKVF